MFVFCRNLITSFCVFFGKNRNCLQTNCKLFECCDTLQVLFSLFTKYMFLVVCRCFRHGANFFEKFQESPKICEIRFDFALKTLNCDNSRSFQERQLRNLRQRRVQDEALRARVGRPGILEGSFLAVSKPIFANTNSTCRIFQALQEFFAFVSV